MDYIKKTVCIEDARTRTQGLMPYFEFGKSYSVNSSGSCGYVSDLELEIASGDNGNWGQFVANPCFLSDYDKTYETLVNNYYRLLNMVRSGVKLRKVSTKNGELIFTEDVGSFYLDDDCYAGGEEPAYLYSYAAYDASRFYSNEIDSLRKETKTIYKAYDESEIDENDDFIVLIRDYDTFLGLTEYLSGTTYVEDLDVADIYADTTEHTVWAWYCSVVDECIGKLNIPAYIYNNHLKAPKSMSYADINGYIDWLYANSASSANCCNLKLWEEMGGQDMLDFLNNSKDGYEETLDKLNNLKYSIPYIELPLLITQNFTDVGVMTNIDGVNYDEELPGPDCDEDVLSRPHGYMTPDEDDSGLTEANIDLIRNEGLGFSIDEIIMSSGISYYPETKDYDEETDTKRPIEVESLLKTLRAKKKYLDDNNDVLPGLFEYFSGNTAGKMYRCIKQGEENFYDLIVEESEYTDESGVTFHTLEYTWQLNESYTKDDIDPGCFYNDDFPGVPYGKFEISENEPNWQEQYDNRLDDMVAYTEDSGNTPISVAPKMWRMEEIEYDSLDFINGDGKPSEVLHYPEEEIHNIEDKFYRTITTCSAGIRIAETEEEETGEDQPFMEHYYFMVKYDNSESVPMEIPYKVLSLDCTTNIYNVDDRQYRGDFITDIIVNEDEKKIKFFYQIGGYFIKNDDGTIESVEDGDIYTEEYPYDDEHVDFVPIDGVENVQIWSKYIDFDAAGKEFYSPRYNLYRTGNTANIIRKTTGDVWNKNFAYDAYLTKEEYLINFSNPPKTDVNVTIDRGGVSAFEKHYKLTECNTMQDLVNYGNNYFNLE